MGTRNLVAGHLMETPVLSGEIALIRPSVVYRFADPELESLSPAQRTTDPDGAQEYPDHSVGIAGFPDKP
ncbi:MAG: DUF3014 domain-containing protein [Methylococcales bacterium]